MNVSYLKESATQAVQKLGGNSQNVLAIMAQFLQEKGEEWWNNPEPPFNVGNIRHTNGDFQTFDSLEAGVQGYVNFLETDPAGYYTKVREAVKTGTPHDVLVALSESPYCFPKYPLANLEADLATVERLLGEAPATEQHPQPEEHTGEVLHTIVRGDTFWGLAKQYYGNTGEYPLIEKLNPGVNPSRLEIGQVVRVK